MPLVKKLIFALPFLLTLAYFFYLVNPILNAADLLLSLNLQALYQTILITGVLLLAGFFYVLFGTFSQDWKLVAPVALAGAILPILFLPAQVYLIVSAGTLITLLFVFALLNNKLKTYLTFQPVILLPSSMKNMVTLMVIFISIASFLVMKSQIQEKGLQIPDSLIVTISQMTLSSANTADFESPLLSPEACQILKTNPQLLIKSGVPKDQLELIDPTTCKLSKPKMEERLKLQALEIIKPYTSFIPYILAFTLFLSLTSIAAILGLLLPFLIWIVFLILKQVGFTKYTTEMREVKKLIV